MTTSFFVYEKPKVIQALRYHFISKREIKFMMILVNVFAIISAILYFVKKISALAFLVSSSLWFVMMIAFWHLLPKMIYRKSEMFKGSYKATLGDGFFRIENNQTSRNWQWNEFSGWMESPHFFHLYFSSRAFFIIPKSAFEEDDEHEARKTLQQKIKK
jgi:hypothetical protein